MTTSTFVHVAPDGDAPAPPAPPAATSAETVRLTPPPPPRVRVALGLPELAALVLAVGVALGLAASALAGPRDAARLAPAGASRAQLVAPTPPLVVPTVAAPAGPLLPVALTAYAEPGGLVLGALPAGLPYVVVGTAYGGGWLQLDIGQARPVWVAAADWGEALIVRPAELADLTPPTPVPTPPPPTPAPAAPAIVAAPAPPPAAELAPVVPPAWHPPYTTGYDPGAPDCPLILAPDELDRCLAGAP